MEPPTGRPGQIPDLNFTYSSLSAGSAGDNRFHDVARKEPHRRAHQSGERSGPRPESDLSAARISTTPEFVTPSLGRRPQPSGS